MRILQNYFLSLGPSLPAPIGTTGPAVKHAATGTQGVPVVN